ETLPTHPRRSPWARRPESGVTYFTSRNPLTAPPAPSPTPGNRRVAAPSQEPSQNLFTAVWRRSIVPSTEFCNPYSGEKLGVRDSAATPAKRVRPLRTATPAAARRGRRATGRNVRTSCRRGVSTPGAVHSTAAPAPAPNAAAVSEPTRPPTLETATSPSGTATAAAAAYGTVTSVRPSAAGTAAPGRRPRPPRAAASPRPASAGDPQPARSPPRRPRSASPG